MICMYSVLGMTLVYIVAIFYTAGLLANEPLWYVHVCMTQTRELKKKQLWCKCDKYDSGCFLNACWME